METLRYIVLVNGLLAVVSVAYYFLLRRETFFGANRLALWLGVAGALFLPLLELPDWRPQPVRAVMQHTAQVIVPRILPKSDYSSDVTITFPNQKTYLAFQAQQKRVVWSWQLGLLLIYVAGLTFLLIRFGIQLFSLHKLIRQSVHEPYDDFILVRNKTVTSPFSFFNQVVLNPNQHTPDELDQILRHERVHVQERHSVDMIAGEFVCIVFWFNPAAYLFRHLLHEILEFSADRAVLTEGIDAKAYQYNLLKVSLSAGQSTLTNHFSKAQLKSRIVMLNQPNSPKRTWLKYPVFFIAALTVASAFARPQHIKALSEYLPKPVSVMAKEVLESPKKIDHLRVEQKSFVSATAVKTSTVSSIKQVLPINQVHLPFDSTSQRPSPASLTRDMTYQENYHHKNVTSDDLPNTARSKDDKEMEALVLAGQQKFGHLVIGPRRFDKEEIKKLSSPGSYLQINTDGSLSVDETANYAKVFINNDPVTPQTVRSLIINQIYSLAVIYGYKPEGQNLVGTRYILFYVDKDK